MEYKSASQRRCSCVANCDANLDKLFPDFPYETVAFAIVTEWNQGNIILI